MSVYEPLITVVEPIHIRDIPFDDILRIEAKGPNARIVLYSDERTEHGTDRMIVCRLIGPLANLPSMIEALVRYVESPEQAAVKRALC